VGKQIKASDAIKKNPRQCARLGDGLAALSAYCVSRRTASPQAQVTHR